VAPPDWWNSADPQNIVTGQYMVAENLVCRWSCNLSQLLAGPTNSMFVLSLEFFDSENTLLDQEEVHIDSLQLFQAGNQNLGTDQGRHRQEGFEGMENALVPMVLQEIRSGRWATGG
jgi:hypothetical protein